MNQNQDMNETKHLNQLPHFTRRDFMRIGGLAAAGGLFTRFQPAMAGPFTGDDFKKLVPEDKKLSDAWVRSLFERGEPEWFSGTELEHIGMPVGGICCGMVYLSGDGRLWHWDIFNQYRDRSKTANGQHYSNPMPVTSPVDIGFQIRANGETRALDRKGFPQVRFRGAYPIGFVDYHDEAFPVKVSLEAFSPFAPLDVDGSSLPLTVMRYTLRNTTQKKVEVDLSGALANPVLIDSGTTPGVELVNRVVKQSAATCLHCTAETVDTDTPKNPRTDIVLSDKALPPESPLDQLRDMGDMTLALIGDSDGVTATPATTKTGARGLGHSRPKGSLSKTLSLAPGKETTVSFAVAWRFANQASPVDSVPDKGHYYAKRFPSSLAVIDHHAAEHADAYARTRLWHDTWYDSSLPYWLLDRTFLNTSVLASTTCLRFEGGRFWGWEGIGCCPGTCTHVWHYAQSVGRVFPELERILREDVDYGVALQPDGSIWFRAEAREHEAIDGQAGTILRVLREHTMSPDDAFLRQIWPRVKRSIEFLIQEDGDGNGVLEGQQHNTLDASWYGPISWISSLYLAALRAGTVMAREMDDPAFAKQCDQLVESGSAWIAENLFNGEYFYHERDPKHPEAIGSGIGCLIDQVFGQGWAHQLGLGRVLPEDKTVSALQSLWRYNFTPDVGPYRAEFKGGRWYALPGEAGLLMCTFPNGGERAARGGNPGHGFAGYFNECMNGFEYQVAWHMIAEGMVKEGLAVTRAVHDRYSASRRNPYNEIECGDHYARSMASHGVFISICGFECHGPKKHLGFAPKMHPEAFKAPFITAEGWGSYSQHIAGGTLTAEIDVHHGKLPVATLALEHEGTRTVRVKQGDITLPATLIRNGQRILITLDTPVDLAAGRKLEVILS